jgi:V/A-type H+-transporting ATPase subunit C
LADDTRYAYAVARIRGLETRLLDRQWIERLLAEDASGALKVLSDSAFQEVIADVHRPEDLERALTRMMAETLGVVSGIAPDPELIDLFRVRYDFRNLRSLVKASLLKMLTDEVELPVDELGLTDGPGTVALSVLVEAAVDDDYLMLPTHLADAARRATDAHRDLGELSLVDAILVRAMWEHQLTVAHASGSDFLVDYIRAEIDLANIKAFVRIKQVDGEVSDIERVFVPGGTLGRSFFDEFLGEPHDSLARALEYGDYSALAPVFREWTSESGPALELACDNLLLSRVDHASRVAYGVDPLVAFILMRSLEVKLVRAAVTSKLDGIARDELEKRLRAVHV